MQRSRVSQPWEERAHRPNRCGIRDSGKSNGRPTLSCLENRPVSTMFAKIVDIRRRLKVAGLALSASSPARSRHVADIRATLDGVSRSLGWPLQGFNRRMINALALGGPNAAGFEDASSQKPPESGRSGLEPLCNGVSRLARTRNNVGLFPTARRDEARYGTPGPSRTTKQHV